MSMNYTTLFEMLEQNRDADRAVTYIESENAERRVSFGEQYARAVGILYLLQAHGAQRGDKMIIYLDNNEQFMDGYWAAICGGIIPVPLALGITAEHRQKVLRVARKIGNAFLYTDNKSLERLETLAHESGEAELFAKLRTRSFLVGSISDISKAGKIHRARPEDLASIQFSSGSTSEPKGVMLTHHNIVSNAKAAQAVDKFNSSDVSLSWMPLTHDMGLIGFYFMQFANRVHVNLMPTDVFVRRPLLWMMLAAKKGVTITCSPNFGYRHFLKVLGKRKLENTDLTRVRSIYNGAEPISIGLCNEFMNSLAHTGLRRSAMFCVYGLAEAALAVTFPKPGTEYGWIRVNRHKLGIGARIELNPLDVRDSLELMCVGTPVPTTEIRICGADCQALEPEWVGHIWIRGPSVSAGYFGDPQATADAIDAEGWLDTNDLGFFHEGNLYIAGRSKELLFVNGQNYYPYDLENIAQRAPGLDLNKVVVAGVGKSDAEGEDLCVFVLHRKGTEEFTPIAAAVRRLINEHTGLEVAQVIPVNRIPKTTSGKVQRHVLVRAFIDGDFDQELLALNALRSTQEAAGPVSGVDLEETLRRICEAALSGKRVGIDDNLFEIGASSLKLIEIHEKINREYPNIIDLTDLFDHPSVRALARYLKSKI